ncbi:hydroxysteroid dehydrogenase-like protein 3 [Leptotrombidium deliense]|uniref:Hydroxysteroid dehydrogenase-like protein 3 n=1 Tax=Leptotrombidium deliense TaxID=299467 RepID=A0A443S0P1_9ACAR|nr:hydroxysteroid dehydrogenase-like protein 3 [Leptotrombidium deliense]
MNETDSSFFQTVDNFLDKYPVSGIFSIIIGCIWLLLRFYFFVTGIYRGFKQFLWPSCRTLDFFNLYGEYVIITAASNGIGFQFGKQFLKRGHSVVLIDYDAEQLTTAKEELQKYVQNGRDLMIVAIEKNYDEAYQNVQRQFENIKGRIGILINNANVTLSKEEYLKYSIEQISDTIRCNIISVLMITKKILPFMVQNEKGHILNITSPTGCQPISSSGFFDATKYFVDFFGKTLLAEYAIKNITVQTLNPGFIVAEGDTANSRMVVQTLQLGPPKINLL